MFRTGDIVRFKKDLLRSVGMEHLAPLRGTILDFETIANEQVMAVMAWDGPKKVNTRNIEPVSRLKWGKAY